MNDARVQVIPSPAPKHGHLTVRYNGLLANSGADAIWVHHGFDGWLYPVTTAMAWNPDGTCTATIDARGTKEINLCFKDSANNWDDNGGWNWNCPIV